MPETDVLICAWLDKCQELKKMLRFTGITFLLMTLCLNAEPSVYGFDNGSSKAVKKNTHEIIILKRKIAQLQERLEGLTTVVEGLSATINALQQHQNVSGSGEGKAQTALLKELGNMIDQINANYVSRDELQKILSNEQDSAVKPHSATGIKQQGDKALGKKKASTLYSEGVRLFQKKRYDEAKKRFAVTDTRGYKPAASNYYLGEIAYYTGHYDDAIFYFKKSAGLYDQAGYIDVLLLHTAIALEKIGDRKQAKRFYENIVANYPGKKTAQIAQKKLKSL
jgi:TolA-binding protein